uniref:BHLH domain-containing protein n=1 Tax=Parastrongyloides trichosuri TaxID=131310 RepID=A0A0N4ZCP3_PARTI
MMSNKLSPNMFDEMPMDRKDKKPLMERKRRARMNDSLNELKNLILFISPQLKSKLEKADILELTVHYFRQLVSLQMNSLSSLNVPPGYIEDEGKCLKKEQKLDYNLIDNKLLQTPNGASFLSPPSSVSPDYDTNNTNLFSLNGDTPSYYGINRKRKQKFDEYKNDYLPNTLHSLGTFKARFSSPCFNNTFNCGDGTCLSMKKVHDSYPDCSDGSDEFCFPGYVKCGKICVEAKNADNCIGFDNCYESKLIPKFCPYLKQKLCNANGTFHCKGYGECIFVEWMFDKKQDCYDGSDLDMEYVSIFKKLINNQYPEELLYHSKSIETSTTFSVLKPVTTTYISTFPTLFPNNFLIPIVNEPFNEPKITTKILNRKPLEPPSGLDLMSESAIITPAYNFPTLIPYQVSKTKVDFIEKNKPYLNILSTTIRPTLSTIIYPFSTPVNENINGHFQTTLSANYLVTLGNGKKILNNGTLYEKLNFKSAIEKNIGLDNSLKTFKGNESKSSDAFIGEANKQINNNDNYQKLETPSDKFGKQIATSGTSTNDMFYRNLFGDEKLITDKEKNIQTTISLKEILTDEKIDKENMLSPTENKMSKVENGSAFISNFDKINENNIKSPSTQTKSQESIIANINNKSITNYYSTINTPFNYYTTLPTIKETEEKVVGYKLPSSIEAILKYQSSSQKPSDSFENVRPSTTTHLELDLHETTTISAKDRTSIIDLKQLSQTTSSIKNIKDNKISEDKQIVPLLSKPSSEEFGDKINYENPNILGKGSKLSQNWNFFGIPVNHSDNDIYFVNKSQLKSKSTTKVLDSLNAIKNIFTSNESTLPFETITTTSEPIKEKINDTLDVKGMILPINKPVGDFLEKQNISKVKSSNKTTYDEKNQLVTDTQLSTEYKIETTTEKFKTLNEVEKYNNCVVKSMQDIFYRPNILSDTMCKCPPGEISGFLGICQYKNNFVVLKLHLEKFCGQEISSDIEKRVTQGIISSLMNEDDIENACFRKTKNFTYVAEVFCTNCSTTSINDLFQRGSLQKKYNTNFYFSEGGQEFCDNSDLNFCDKNATCIPLNDKYQCVCNNINDKTSELVKVETEYGRNCSYSNVCTMIFGICIMYWLLLIPFLLFFIPCICCLLYRLIVNYEICGYKGEKFKKNFAFNFKSKRRKSRNVIIEDMKGAQKWHPEDTRPSSVHSTNEFQSTSRRKSSITLIDDEFLSRKSLKSRTSSIHSAEDYMIVDDETMDQQDQIPGIMETKAEIHDAPTSSQSGDALIQDDSNNTNNKSAIERQKSTPLFKNIIQSKPSFHSLSEFKEGELAKSLRTEIFKSRLVQTFTRKGPPSVDTNKSHVDNINLLDSSLENVSSTVTEEKTPEKVIETIPTQKSTEQSPKKGTQKTKEFESISARHSLNSLLSNQPIIEEEEEELPSRAPQTFLDKLGGVRHISDEAMTSEATNNSVKSLPYVNNDQKNNEINRQSISATGARAKFLNNKRNVSTTSLLNTNVEQSSSETNLIPVASTSKDMTSTDETKESNGDETLWEHYKHHPDTTEFSQTDSMEELENMFLARIEQISEDTSSPSNYVCIEKTTEKEEPDTSLSKQTLQHKDLSKEDSYFSIKVEQTKEEAEANRVDNLLEDITTVSDYDYKKDDSFINIKKRITSGENRQNHEAKPPEKSFTEKKLEKNNDKTIQKLNLKTKNDDDIRKKKKEKDSLTPERSLSNLSRKSLQQSRTSSPSIDRKSMSPQITRTKKVFQHKNDKEGSSAKHDQELGKDKKITLKPPIPRFNLSPVKKANSEKKSLSKPIEDKKKISTTPGDKSPIRRIIAVKSPTKFKNEGEQSRTSSSAKSNVHLPVINENLAEKVETTKSNKHSKNIKLPFIASDSHLISKITQLKPEKLSTKVDQKPTSVRKKDKNDNTDIVSRKLSKEIITEVTKKLAQTTQKVYKDLHDIKNIQPTKVKEISDKKKKNVSDVVVTVHRYNKNDDKNLCGYCQHDTLKTKHGMGKEDDAKKSMSIKHEKEKNNLKLELPSKTRELSSISEKSDENTNGIGETKFESLKKDMDYDEYYPEELVITSQRSTFELSRENSQIPIHFDGRCTGLPSARESKKILETEGDYYAGDVDLDLPGPFILPLTKDDMRKCVFNEKDIRKLKTNLPFYDWDRHSEILKHENYYKEKLSHSMSESNLGRKYTSPSSLTKHKIGKSTDKSEKMHFRSQSQSPHIYSKISFDTKNVFKQTSDNKNVSYPVYRQKSNLSIGSSEDRWNLSIVHEGDIDKIPLPPLSHSHQSSSRQQ